MSWLLVFPLLLVNSPYGDSTLLLSAPDICNHTIVFEYGGDLWLVPDTGGIARRLTSDEGFESNPKFSPDGRFVAFSGHYDADNFDVYVIPVDGGPPLRLTYHPASDRVIGWTHDGNHVLFISRRTHWCQPRLYRVSLEGGLPEELPLPVVYWASFSPDGNKVAFNRRPARLGWRNYRGGQVPDVWIYDFDRDTAYRVTDWEGTDICPLWYKDKIYFLSDRDGKLNIYCYDTNTGVIRKVTDHQDFDVELPSLGGSKIVYQCGGTLWVLDLTTERYHRLKIKVPDDYKFVRPRYEDVSTLVDWFDISPHAKRAVLVARGDIFTVPKEKGPVRNITCTAGTRERYAVWSPDGEWIAYLSDESGEYEIYIRKADGTGDATRITYDGECYRWPLVWSPDSKKLLYSDSKLRLFYVDIDNKKPVLVDTSAVDYIWSYCWSPDSRWLAYIKQNDNWYGSVYLYSVETKESYKITTDLYDDDEVCFDPSGKYLYFISSRTFTPARGDFGELRVYPATQNICLITLQADIPSPFLPKSDEELPEEEKEEPEEPEKKPPEKIEIDLEGISQRVVAVPIPAGNYSGLAATEDKIFYLERTDFTSRKHKYNLHVYDIENQKDHVLIEGIDGYRVSEDGKYVLYKADNTFGIIEVNDTQYSVGDGKLKTDKLRLKVDPRQEWCQMLHEAWRLERDFFYDTNMHGVDWHGLYEVYSKFLPYAADRYDLNYLIAGMLRELGASHTYVWGGKLPQKEVKVGLLGVDFELDPTTGFYKFKKIYKGENWQEKRRAPLTEPGVMVKEGEYLIKVEGQLVRYPDNPYKYFENTVDKQVRLEVNDKPIVKGTRTVVVKPISLGNELELRYLDWVETNRHKVETATNGRVGYIHVPNTATWGLKEFGKYFFAQSNKEGLIIDVRYNGGGWSPAMFMDYLQRRPLGEFVSRVGQPSIDPFVKFHGKLVCIINEYAGSGGDMFPYYFRELGLGPLIGNRTWGGLIGCWGWQLMDGGYITVPVGRFRDLKGNWVIENEGVTPDIPVDDRPDLLTKGYDPQLEKAIEVILQKLRE